MATYTILYIVYSIYTIYYTLLSVFWPQCAADVSIRKQLMTYPSILFPRLKVRSPRVASAPFPPPFTYTCSFPIPRRKHQLTLSNKSWTNFLNQSYIILNPVSLMFSCRGSQEVLVTGLFIPRQALQMYALGTSPLLWLQRYRRVCVANSMSDQNP